MKNILIVEDDLGILDSLSFLLSEKYHISAFTNANNAIKSLRQKKPHLIIVDLNMPLINGIDFIKLTNELDSQIPLLVMTACVNAEYKLNGVKHSGLIMKPFDIKEMENRISELIG